MMTTTLLPLVSVLPRLDVLLGTTMTWNFIIANAALVGLDRIAGTESMNAFLISAKTVVTVMIVIPRTFVHAQRNGEVSIVRAGR